ncbi:MAG: 6-bladed beta-propeller [Desulfuromonas sp.]|nr:MAG: 6-bladed beta-propeller [Desulfuromonas sp.]
MFRFGLIALLVLLVLSGCAAKTPLTDEVKNALVWHDNNDQPMIRWEGEIQTPQDAGLKPRFWNRVGAFLFGDRRERILRPYGIHVDSAGRVFIADPGSTSLHLIDIDDRRYRVERGEGDATLLSPVGVTSDGAGSIYLTDSVRGRIYRYRLSEGRLVRFNLDPLARPTGIAFHPENWQIYITDTGAHQVAVFGLDGYERFRFSGRGAGEGELNFPTDLWIDRLGRIFVTDAINARIQMFAADGRYLTTFGARGHASGYFDKPKGVATDSDGHIYVCDSLKDAVQVYDADGRYLFAFGEQGQGPAQFWMPAGLYIDNDDRIYVADAYNHRIQIFQYLKGEGRL